MMLRKINYMTAGVTVLIMVCLYLMVKMFALMSQNEQNQQLTNKIIKKIEKQNDSIIASKTAHIKTLLSENQKSQKIIDASSKRIHQLENSIDSIRLAFRRRKKEVEQLSDKQLGKYWENEFN